MVKLRDGIRTVGRIAQLSSLGCYVDTADPLPVGGFQRSHCAVHLPVGCDQILTVRTGPPACSPLVFRVRSHK